MQMSEINYKPKSSEASRVIELCQKLTTVCDKAKSKDGVGFAKNDVTLGHEIGQWDVERLASNPGTLFAASMMLKRYSETQLTADEFKPVLSYLEGFREAHHLTDISEKEIVRDGREVIITALKTRKADAAKMSTRTIEFDPEDTQTLIFKQGLGYNDPDFKELLDLFRNTPGRRYANGQNTIRVTAKNRHQVKKLADAFCPGWEGIDYGPVIGADCLRDALNSAAEEDGLLFKPDSAQISLAADAKGCRQLVLKIPRWGLWYDPEAAQSMRELLKVDLGFSYNDLGLKGHPQTWQAEPSAHNFESIQDFFLNFGYTIDRNSSPKNIPLGEGVDSYFANKLTETDIQYEQADVFLDDLPGTLRDYQEDGVNYLREVKSGLLTDEMGLGKTVQVCAALPANAKAIIVCPASLRKNWEKELNKWRPDLLTETGTPTQIFRLATFDILITSYTAVGKAGFKLDSRELEILQYTLKELVELGFQPCLIADEVAACKNADAVRTKAFAAMAQEFLNHDGQTWGLDGAPLVNTPLDLWTIMDTMGIAEYSWGCKADFVRYFGGELVRGYQKTSKKGQFRKPREQYNWGKYPKNEEEIAIGMSMATFGRNRRDVLPELPEKTYVRSDLVATPGEIRKIWGWIGTFLNEEAIKRAAREEIRERISDGREDIDFDEVAESLSQEAVAKARNEIDVYLKGGRAQRDELSGSGLGGLLPQVKKMLAMGKAPLAVEEISRQLTQGGGPLVVFSASTSALISARDLFLNNCPGKSSGMLVGGMTDGQKQATVESFQQGATDVLFCNIKAGGRGHTLTAADTMIFMDWSWSDADNKQAEDRICRMGQTSNKCLYIDLILDHWIDEIVAEACHRKQENHSYITESRIQG